MAREANEGGGRVRVGGGGSSGTRAGGDAAAAPAVAWAVAWAAGRRLPQGPREDCLHAWISIDIYRPIDIQLSMNRS